MGSRPVSRLDALLGELCIKYGWCLDPGEWETLMATDAHDEQEVIDSIFRAEFGNAEAAEKETRRWLTSLVQDWLVDPRGRGARSGLPL